jgi:predicted dehydrogenase
MIGVGVIGFGYWGPNLVRNLVETAGAAVVAVADLRQERLNVVRNRYPGIKTTRDYRELLADPAVDAVVVATPVSTHYQLALEALQAGKHVLVEKPLVETMDQGLRLLDEAAMRRLTLMVDHTFIYTGAVRKIKDLVMSGRLGPIYYYDSVRVNLGLFQHDINVLWDLAVHDLSIMDHLLGELPRVVTAVGRKHIGGMEDIAYLTCLFEEDMIAHIHVNWLAPAKVRRTMIAARDQMVVYDDLEPSEKVKVYDKGVTVGRNGGHNVGTESPYELLVGYRTGDMWAPKLATTEALSAEAAHFIECIDKSQQPITNGEAGLRVVHILEAASRSMDQMGQPVELSWEAIAL